MSRRREIGVIVGLALAAVWWGTWYSGEATRRGERFALYDFAYGPAVMVACGRGYINPDLQPIPQLAAFLQTRNDRFECASLPASIAEQPLTGFQRTFRFLMLTTATVWKIGGISWSALAYLSGAMFAATIVLVYLTVRLVAPWWIALAAALLTLTSPLQLAYLSDFRNYPKAPLAIGLGYLLGLLGKGGSPGRLIGTGIAFGAVLGFGLGFRQDLLIYLPAFLLVVLVARAAIPARSLRTRIATVAAAMIACVIALGPQLAAYAPGGGASVQHVATLGLMSPFDGPLGVSADQLYEWGYYNEDSFATATITAHGRRRLGITDAITVYDRAYDRAATSYWTELIRAFPADLLTRGYASVLHLIELPSSTSATQVPSLVRGRWFEAVWTARAALLNATTGIWTLLAVLAILLAATESVRVGLVVGLLIAYLLAYPAVQFHERHYFYLDIIPLTAAAFALVQLARWRSVQALPGARRATRAATAAVLLAVCATVPLFTARTAQAQSVHRLLHSYADAQAEPIAAPDRALTDGGVAIDLAPAVDRAGFPPPEQTLTELFAVTLGGPSCDRVTVDLTLRYRTSHANPDFTRTRTIGIGRAPGLTRVFIPGFTYQSEVRPVEGVVWYQPGSIEVAAGQRHCLAGVSRLRGIDAFPIVLTAVLLPGWEQLKPYQTINGLERRPRVVTVLRTDPAGLASSGTAYDVTSVGRLTGPVSRREVAEGVRIEVDGRWSVAGRKGLGGRGQMFYLAQLRDTPMRAKQLLVAEGVLDAGGLSIGLVRNGQWAAQVPVTEPGPFIIMIEAPDTAAYDVILANNLSGRFQSNHFVLTRFGLLP